MRAVPRVLVAGMGFTVDFVLRRVADLGRGEVLRVILVGLRTEDRVSWERVLEAHRILSGYLKALGIESELVEAPASEAGLLGRVRDALARAASLAGEDGLVEVYLTGGPRILCLALTLASLTLPPGPRRRVRLVAYGEGFEARLEVRADSLAALLQLDEEHRALLEALARLGRARASRLLEELGWNRSTLYLRLSRLEALGLVARSGGEWMVHPAVEPLL